MNNSTSEPSASDPLETGADIVRALLALTPEVPDAPTASGTWTERRRNSFALRRAGDDSRHRVALKMTAPSGSYAICSRQPR